VVAYGCFVDVGTTTDGLVHISQLSDSFVKDIYDFVTPGQKVTVRVIGVEGEKKLSLTMRTSDGPRKASGGFTMSFVPLCHSAFLLYRHANRQ
jgi:S1 RNA binding domain protein